MAFPLRRRTFLRLLFIAGFLLFIRLVVFSPSSPASNLTGSFYNTDPLEIQKQGVLDLVTRERSLDARKHKFLQARLGRDEREDIFSNVVNDGLEDYWNRFQKP